MSLTLNLPPDTERKLYQRASQAGETIERLALKFIEGTERASVRIQKFKRKVVSGPDPFFG
jgi:hypothetical protein